MKNLISLHYCDYGKFHFCGQANFSGDFYNITSSDRGIFKKSVWKIRLKNSGILWIPEFLLVELVDIRQAEVRLPYIVFKR
jgi:hypothetical protein